MVPSSKCKRQIYNEMLTQMHVKSSLGSVLRRKDVCVRGSTDCPPARAHTGFPGDSVVKNPPANAGHVGAILGSGRSPREGSS